MALEQLLNEVHKAFVDAGGEREPQGLEFWLNLLDQQVIEGRKHLAAGEPDRVCNEIADVVSVAWQALVWQDKDPLAFIENRCRTRIIPHARAIKDRDLAGNGYKGA